MCGLRNVLIVRSEFLAREIRQTRDVYANSVHGVCKHMTARTFRTVRRDLNVGKILGSRVRTRLHRSARYLPVRLVYYISNDSVRIPILDVCAEINIRIRFTKVRGRILFTHRSCMNNSTRTECWPNKKGNILMFYNWFSGGKKMTTKGFSGQVVSQGTATTVVYMCIYVYVYTPRTIVVYA